jgi:hypothetical protein
MTATSEQRAGSRRDLQLWLYPEEIGLASPEGVAELGAELGVDALSVALTYHQCMRVFPRYGAIRPGAPGGMQFEPEQSGYGRLVPTPGSGAVGADQIRALRDACAAVGLAFRAWIVVLDNEQLAHAHPDCAAQTLDGTPTAHALCPSKPDVHDYVAALVSDVARQFEPELIELEAALYPRWNSYLAEIALDAITPTLKLFGAQCLCPDCAALLADSGIDVSEARSALTSAAGPPPHDTADHDADLLRELTVARDRGVGTLIEHARSIAPAGVRVRLLGFGTPVGLALQGLGRHAAAAADEVLIGLGPASGATLAEELDAHVAAPYGPPAAVGLNWTPDRGQSQLLRDALTIRDRGLHQLAVYNLSLMTAAGLEQVRATAQALASDVTDRPWEAVS